MDHASRRTPESANRRRDGDSRSAAARAPAGRWVASVLSSWVDGARQLAWIVVVATLAATAGGAYYAATHLGIVTDTDALLSEDLPYRKAQAELNAAFPQLSDNIAIVIDGTTPDQAEDAAIALAAALRAEDRHLKAVFSPLGEPFFRSNGMLFLDVPDLQDLADRLADAQPLLATLAEDASLRGFFDVLGLAVDDVMTGKAQPDLLVQVFQQVADTTEVALNGQPTRLSWRGLMQPEAPAAADYRQFITVQPRPDYSTLAPSEEAIETIRRAAAKLDLDEAHGVRVRLTGGLPIREDELRSVRDSVGLASVISLVLVTVLVFIGLRSLRLVVGALVSLLAGLAGTAAFAALAIGHLNLISIAFAVLYIGLAVDFSIQYGLRYLELANDGATHSVALRGAAAGTGSAVSLAALCAAIGFLAFTPTAYIGLSELGFIAGAGMAIGLFCTLTVLPAMLTLMPPRPDGRSLQGRSASDWYGAFAQQHARAICLAAAVIGLAAVVAAAEVRFDFDPINLRDPNTESVQTYRDLAADSDTSPYSMNVLTTDLASAVELGHRLDGLAEVAQTVTLESFVPADQEVKLTIIDSMALFLGPVLDPIAAQAPPTPAQHRDAVARFQGKLAALSAWPQAGDLAQPAQRLAGLLAAFIAGPEPTAAAYSSLETALLASLPGRLDGLRDGLNAGPVTVDDIPAGLGARYVAADGRARLEVFPAERLTDRAALLRFVDQVQSIAPKATDTPVLLLRGSEAVMAAFREAGALALIAISVVLVLVLRSVVDALLVLAPLMLALVLTMAVMVLTGMSFNFANIIALPLLLSLGVAFGVYLVLRWREGGDIADLLRTSTPRAVLFSALTTMASFGSLMISSHRGTASMGLLLAIALSLAVVCTLVVLPALLAWRRRRRVQSTA